MDSTNMDMIKNNFDKDGTHFVTHTLFNTAGFNKDGFDKLGKKK